MKKLYSMTSNEFSLFHHISLTGETITTNAGNIPKLHYPDGSWCYPANSYMLNLYQKGLSRRNNGGTLFTYATQISHLIRFCFHNKIEFNDISDNYFTIFIKSLRAERHSSGTTLRKREETTIINIGRRCLDFLDYISKLYDNDSLLGPGGQVRAEKKQYAITLGKTRSYSGKMTKNYWHHHSFPSPSPEHKVHPIANEVIKKLEDAVLEVSKTTFLKKRRYVLLRLLQITGGRRSEIDEITNYDVYKAKEMNPPMLNLITIKRGGNNSESREIPISKFDCMFLIEYIEKNRAQVIRRTCGNSRDSGHLLISQTTGEKLSSNTITQEISTLSKAAGVNSKACPHMFRHRFITKLFVLLIKAHEITSPDDFRRRLLDAEHFKKKVQEWSGHKSIQSLDRYIDLAFDEIYESERIINIVRTISDADALKNSLNNIKHSLETGESLPSIASKLQDIIKAIDENKS